MANLGGGDKDSIARSCRKPEVMSDAAYIILSKNSNSYTGNFAIDEDVLRDAGVTDLGKYSCVPGSTLGPDLFLDIAPVEPSSTSGPSGGPEAVFTKIKAMLNRDLVSAVGGVYQFILTGKDGGEWYVNLKSGSGSAGRGRTPDPQCTVTMESTDFVRMFAGELKPMQAYMSGQLKIRGNMALAMKLETLMDKMKSRL